MILGNRSACTSLCLGELAGPADGVVDDPADSLVEVCRVRLVAGAEVEDSSDTEALVDAIPWTGGEFRIDSLADGPADAAGEGLATEREIALEDEDFRGGNVERRSVHFLCFEREVFHALGDRVPGGADSDLLRIVGFSPATLEVTGGVQDSLKGLGIVAGVKADEAHPSLVDVGSDALGKLVFDFSVAGMTPPKEDVGFGKETFRDALLGFIQVSDLDAEFVELVELLETGGDGAAKVLRIDFFRGVAGILIPDENANHDRSLEGFARGLLECRWLLTQFGGSP